MVERSRLQSISFFETSIQDNLEILAGNGELGGKFLDALGRSSDYDDVRVIEAYTDLRGRIVAIACPASRSTPLPHETAGRRHGPRVIPMNGQTAHRTLFLVDVRAGRASIDVIVPTDLEPEGRAVLWETTRRFRGPLKLAA